MTDKAPHDDRLAWTLKDMEKFVPRTDPAMFVPKYCFEQPVQKKIDANVAEFKRLTKQV